MSKNLLAKLNSTFASGELFEFVDGSLSATQVLYKLGFSNKGQYVKIVKDYLVDNELDTAHFTYNGVSKIVTLEKICPCCGKTFTCFKRSVKEQIVCSRACSNTYFRSGVNNGNFITGAAGYRLKALNHYGYKCNRCGYDANKAAIVVHHKDHNRENSDIDNLEVLCANCHTIHHCSD